VQPEIINKLEEKAAAMLRDRQLIAQASANEDSANSPEKSALAGYASLVKDSNVPVGIRYLALHSIAGKHKFYDDPRDQPQMLGTVAEAMGNLQPGAVVKSIQYIKTEYPSIYQLEQGIFDRYEAHAVGFMTRLPVKQQNKTVAEGKDTHLNPIPVVVEPPPVSPPPPPLVPPIPPSIAAEPRYEPAISQVDRSTTNTTLKPDPALNQNSNKGAFIIGGAMISGAIIFSTLLLSSQNHQTSSDSSSSIDSSPSNNGVAQSPIVTEQSPIVTASPPVQDQISQDEANNLIERWQQAKRTMFAPPYDQQLGAQLATGLTYSDKVHGPSSDGTPYSSLEWLREYGYYYKYDVQNIEKITRFESNGDVATVEVQMLEDAKLYDKKGDLQPDRSGIERKIVRFMLKKENGILKISNYGTIGDSKRKS
jgi:ARC6-like, IMS domain